MTVPGLGREEKRLRRGSQWREGGPVRWQLAGALEKREASDTSPVSGQWHLTFKFKSFCFFPELWYCLSAYIILKVCYPGERAWPSELRRVGITVDTLISYFLGQTHYQIPYFTKKITSQTICPIFFSKNIVTVEIIPVKKMKKKGLFQAGGKAPQRAYDSTNLKVGPGSKFS